MIPKKIRPLRKFIGRKLEWERLSALGDRKEPSILVVYGRRRVGKTELLEQVYARRNILKFEGLQGKPQNEQISHLLRQLSEYAKEPLLAKMNVQSWTEIFEIVAKHLPKGKWTLYFEEVQWLADYKDDFISELKYVWDNVLRHKSGLLLILCGSSPSFMINHVLHSKSLYNRSQNELHLQEFSISETAEYFKNKSQREVMDAYLTIGGIPEYLKRCEDASSTFTSICKNAFLPDSFFSKEYNRIFISSLAENKHYRSILQFLALRRFATRSEILKHLRISSSGTLSQVLQDLTLCGFIEKTTPYHLRPESHLARFCIADHYLQFYYKFIEPIEKDVQLGMYLRHPTAAMQMEQYQKWLGYTFERFCRRHHPLISRILGFHGIRYRAGAYFDRGMEFKLGSQWDLLFDRDDKVMTLCEIKYTQAKVGTQIIEEFERKIALLPNQQKKSLHRVLISAGGASEALQNRHYFDRVITLDDLFAADRDVRC